MAQSGISDDLLQKYKIFASRVDILPRTLYLQVESPIPTNYINEEDKIRFGTQIDNTLDRVIDQVR